MSGGGGTATATSRKRACCAEKPICHVLNGTLTQPRAARAIVASYLAGWPDDDLHDVAVCVSEIATNAVRHTRSGLEYADGHGDGRFALTVEVRDGGGVVRVEVFDSGVPNATLLDGDPAADRRDAEAAQPGEHQANDEIDIGGLVLDVGGLGLEVVNALARGCWGYELTDYGRKTWFEYRRRAGT